MKLQRLVVLVCLVAAAVAAAAAQEDAHVYCGRNLALTLAMLCENGMLVKRAESVGARGYSAPAPRGWPWLAPFSARSLQRGKRQVASECCDKPCTIDELLSYCA